MQFRLMYDGVLPSNGSPIDKQRIRRALHPQLEELWTHPPLSGCRQYLNYPADENEPTVIHRVGDFNFATLVCAELDLFAELEIVLLRPTNAGALIRQGGDIDNRLKTLFDALRAPHSTNELPANDVPAAGEDPLFCLLDDDERIVSLTVSADRYLAAPDERSVRVDMLVRTRPERGTWANLSLL